MAERKAGKWTVVADGSVPSRPWYAFRWDDPIDRDGQDFATWREAFTYANTMSSADLEAARLRRFSPLRFVDLCGSGCDKSHWELRA